MTFNWNENWLLDFQRKNKTYISVVTSDALGARRTRRGGTGHALVTGPFLKQLLSFRKK